MVEAKQDRRVQKTQQALQNALIELILEKGYDAVMIQDILDRANVGRSTFYAHYTDKEALLMSRLDQLRGAFEEHFQAVQGISSGVQLNLPLFVLRYVEHEHQLFKALFGKRGSGKYTSHLHTFLLKFVRDILKSYGVHLPTYERELVAHYITQTFLSMLVWWVDNNMPCSAEDLYGLLMRLIEPGLKDVLHTSTLWA